MLCFTMKRGEYFTVGSDTVILFDQLSSDRVHLSIHAPRDVPIVRSAVLERSGNPPPPCVTALPVRKKSRYKPDAIFRWNDERERAVRKLQNVADQLEEHGAREEAASLREQLEQIIPSVWEDNLAEQ